MFYTVVSNVIFDTNNGLQGNLKILEREFNIYNIHMYVYSKIASCFIVLLTI